MLQSHIPLCTILHICAHFCCKMVHYGTFVQCIMEFMRWIYYICVVRMTEAWWHSSFLAVCYFTVMIYNFTLFSLAYCAILSTKNNLMYKVLFAKMYFNQRFISEVQSLPYWWILTRRLWYIMLVKMLNITIALWNMFNFNSVRT